jgi:hypothetical protein
MPHEVKQWVCRHGKTENNEVCHCHDGPDEDWDATLVLPKTQPQWEVDRNMARFDLVKDALDLIVELWPQPGYASVTMETHQWIKLRRALLAIPDLVANDE